MVDVLTDAQRERLQYLVDNFLAARRRAMDGARRENEAWTPGPGSWRPGDPLPPARPLEPGTFPRQVNRQE